MLVVGVAINPSQEAVLLMCKDDVDFEGAKEIYADNGEGGLDVYTGFENHCLEPFEKGMDDEELVEFLRKFSNDEYGTANFAVRLSDGVVGVCTDPEAGNPVKDAATGRELYPSLLVTTSEITEEYEEYCNVSGVVVE